MKRIATGANRSIDKAGRREGITKRRKHTLYGGRSSEVREKMVVKKKGDDEMELLSVWPSYTADGEIFLSIDRSDC